jgi:hypothetical protein
MSSLSQIEANRLNAQLSTGPRSAEGKAVSRFNALKHGLDAKSYCLPGEDPAILAVLHDAYQEQFHPSGPVEVHLVRTLVLADWKQQRYAALEPRVVQRLADPNQDPGDAIADLFTKLNEKSNPLKQLFRLQQAEQRAWFRALKELQRLQKTRGVEETAADEDSGAEKTPAIGFVPEKMGLVVAPASEVPSVSPSV